jgi:hypothetical protein
MKTFTHENFPEIFNITKPIVHNFKLCEVDELSEDQLDNVKRDKIKYCIYSHFKIDRIHPGYDLCPLNFKEKPYCEFSYKYHNWNAEPNVEYGYCNKCDEEFTRKSSEHKWTIIKRPFSKLVKVYWKTQENCNDLLWAAAILTEKKLWQNEVVELALRFINNEIKIEICPFDLSEKLAYYVRTIDSSTSELIYVNEDKNAYRSYSKPSPNTHNEIA